MGWCEQAGSGDCVGGGGLLQGSSRRQRLEKSWWAGMEGRGWEGRASRHRTEDTGMRQEEERRLLPGPRVDGGPFTGRGRRGERERSAQSAEYELPA